MKAIRLSRPGGPEALEYADVPTPVPGAGQVLVKADSIGVCMPEVRVRKGVYAWMPPLPAIIGIEMSGTVVEAGAGVATLRAGDPVFVSARELPHRGGCYAEYIAVDAAAVYPLPRGIDLEAAACLSNYQVAWHVLYSATRGFSYDTVLAATAAGGVGSAIVQLARDAGKQVIGLTGSDAKVRFVLGLGAGHAFNYKTEPVAERVREATHGRGVDLVLDAVGGQGFAKIFDYLAPLGMVVSYGALDGPPAPEAWSAMRARLGESFAVRIFSMHVFDHVPEKRQAATRELIALLRDGKIKPAIHARLPLAEAGAAQAMLERGEVLGKVILKPPPS